MSAPVSQGAEALRRQLYGEGESETPGIRPAVSFADHSYPAFSAKQMFDFAMSARKQALEETVAACQAQYREGDMAHNHAVNDCEYAIRALGSQNDG